MFNGEQQVQAKREEDKRIWFNSEEGEPRNCQRMFTEDILLSVLLRSAPARFPGLKLSRLDLGPELEIWQTSNPGGSQRNIIQLSLFIMAVCAYCKFFLDSRDIWSCYVSRSKYYVQEFDPTGKNKPRQQDGDALSWPRFIVLLHLFRVKLCWGFTE